MPLQGVSQFQCKRHEERRLRGVARLPERRQLCISVTFGWSPLGLGEIVGYFILYIHASFLRDVSALSLYQFDIHSMCTGRNSCAKGVEIKAICI